MSYCCVNRGPEYRILCRFRINGDFSYDDEMAKVFNSSVHSFDPRYVRHVFISGETEVVSVMRLITIIVDITKLMSRYKVDIFLNDIKHITLHNGNILHR